MANITLSAYNSIAITAASGANRLVYPNPGYPRTVDVLNLGPGAVFIRADVTNPTVNDPAALQLPANYAFNGLKVDSALGIGIIAAADTTISVRLT